MDSIKAIRVLGLMSGTSLEGVDAAIITTDGVDIFDFGPSATFNYDDELLIKIRKILGLKPDTPENAATIQAVEAELTSFHAEVVQEFLDNHSEKIDLIGFHGHSLIHDSKNRYTHQIGDGQLLANLTQTKVVNHFHQADVSAGGQGAPLEPIYYVALSGKMGKPLVVLNIGGTSSLTWVGNNGEMLAFDAGPGNAAINDWVLKHGGMHMDYNGKLAITGKIDEHILSCLMRHKFFGLYPPKSVDRNLFNDKLEHLEGLSLADGAATATAFVAEAIVYSLAMYVSEMPQEIIVCGGGAKNPSLVRFLRQRLENVEVKTAADIGWNADALEAQVYAYLAVRRLFGMPNSFPGTTGVSEPIIGGDVYSPQCAL